MANSFRTFVLNYCLDEIGAFGGENDRRLARVHHALQARHVADFNEVLRLVLALGAFERALTGPSCELCFARV